MVIILNKRKIKRLRKGIIDNQSQYEKLRKKAHFELIVLEEYFGKWLVDKEKIYSEIQRHLEANQKELTYNGLRGVILGILTTILVYIFNTGIIAPLLKLKLSISNWVADAIGIVIGTMILGIFFLTLYFLGAGQFFIDDLKRRKQLYINEYMLKIVQEKIQEIKEKKN